MHPTKSLTLLERLHFIGVFLRLPFGVLFSVTFSPFIERLKHKRRLNRVIAEALSRFVTDRASPRQIQWASGQSIDAYEAWAKSNNVTPVIEELPHQGQGEAAKLVWLTEKRTDRVLLYVHGGGYVLPLLTNLLSFCARLREEVLKEAPNKHFGVVALVYSLVPTKFPTQVTQCTLGVEHLLSPPSGGPGVKPENLMIMGDSAGGNLAIQFMLHTMHPVPGVSPSPLTPQNRLAGLLLISPWFSLGVPTPSYAVHPQTTATKGDLDVVDGKTLLEWGGLYTEGTSEDCMKYIRPVLSAPAAAVESGEPSASLNAVQWFKGLEEYVGRVLITAGSFENLLDDSTGLFEALKPLSDFSQGKFEVVLDVEERGIHEDPIFDMNTPSGEGGTYSGATMGIVRWVREGFGGA